MKPLELIWFENVSSFTEPVLGLGPIRASLKQFLYTLIGLALAFALMQLSLLLIPLAFLMIALAYLKPYGQDLETLLIDMVGFFFKKKSVGIVTEEQKKQKEEKKKDKDNEKEKERKERTIVTERTVETESVPTPTATIPAPATAVIEPITTISTPPITIPTITGAEQKNLLHYIVPSTKDFDLKITEKEYVIATGESTIHIEHEQKDAVILLTIRNGTVTEILVNRQTSK